MPSNIGGAHWGGVAYEPARQIAVVPVNRIEHLRGRCQIRLASIAVPVRRALVQLSSRQLGVNRCLLLELGVYGSSDVEDRGGLRNVIVKAGNPRPWP